MRSAGSLAKPKTARSKAAARGRGKEERRRGRISLLGPWIRPGIAENVQRSTSNVERPMAESRDDALSDLKRWSLDFQSSLS